MKKLVLALVLMSSAALAEPKLPEVRPESTASHGPAARAEEAEAPAEVKLWDTKVFNNEQPPLAAVLFNFALLVLIYWRFGKKPAAEAIKNRKISIATAIENAQRILKEAKTRSKRYRAKQERVAEDAAKAKQTQISTGEGEAELILRNAAEKAERIKRDAAFLLEQEKKQTQIDLVRETVERAARDAEELLKRGVTPADQERLAEEFVSKLLQDYEKGLPVG
jgi:F-type H+-transporting ATPase subunit b